MGAVKERERERFEQRDSERELKSRGAEAELFLPDFSFLWETNMCLSLVMLFLTQAALARVRVEEPAGELCVSSHCKFVFLFSFGP